MSHKSGHIIIRLALPHREAELESAGLQVGPSVSVELPDGCSEDECAEVVRLAYRKLHENG